MGTSIVGTSINRKFSLRCATEGRVDRPQTIAVFTTLVMGVIAALAPCGQAVAQPPLVMERRIAMDRVGGRIDHMAIDLGRKRLIVAALGNGTVELVDLVANKVTNRIDGLRSPQGIGYVAGADLILVASAGDGSVRMFRGGNLAPEGVVQLGADADNVRIDSHNGHAFVGYGSGGLAVIDPLTASVLARVPLPAHPEGFQLNLGDHRVFVNLPDARQIAVVDLAAGRAVASWPLPNLLSNFPMAIDEAGDRLAVAFRHPARLAVLAPSDGTVIASHETCGDADDVFFDDRRRRIYVSCGTGVIDVFEQAGTLRQIARIPTAAGARTALFVPALDRLYVAARAGLLGGQAAILVFRPQP